jgi:hypothetical protein
MAGQNSITGTLPSELFELPNLQAVHLQYNFVSGSIPDNIGQAKSLGESRSMMCSSHDNYLAPIADRFFTHNGCL